MRLVCQRDRGAPGPELPESRRGGQPSPSPHPPKHTPHPGRDFTRGRKDGLRCLNIKKHIIMHNKKTQALVYINTALTEYPFPNSPSGSRQPQSNILNTRLPFRPPGAYGLGWWGAEWGMRVVATSLGQGAEQRAGRPGIRTFSQDIHWDRNQSPRPQDQLCHSLCPSSL